MLFGLQAAERTSIGRVITPALHRLNDRFGETTMLILRKGNRSLCVSRLDGAHFIETLTGSIGGSVPLGVGPGSIAILSSLPPAERAAIIAHNTADYSRFRNVTPELVEQRCVEAWDCGFAFDAGELIIGVSGISVPLRGHDNAVVGSIGFTLLTERATHDHVMSCVGALQSEARAAQKYI